MSVALVGKVRKKYLPKEEGREGGEDKKRTQRARRGPGLEPGTYRMLDEGPQLHAIGAAETSLSVP